MPVLKELIETCSRGLIERRVVVEAIVLAAVAREHVLLVGPPGTAKSEAARRVARGLGGRYFEYLLGRFSEPSELFGPTDLRKLKDGVLETATEGMLPEAEVAFLDEVFAGSTAILNTLLTLLNERVYRRGNTKLESPLRVCIGATNSLPADESLAAFADRFLIRCFLQPVPNSRLEDLLLGGRQPVDIPSGELSTLDEISKRAQEVDLSPILPELAEALRRLRQAGIGLSDRRSVRSQNLLAAAAALDGRTVASRADLWPILLVIPEAEGQAVGRECLASLLEETDSSTLHHLAEELSSGPAVRSRMLVEASRKALEEPRDPLKIEGVLRDIDANFEAENLSPELAEMRAQLRTSLP